MKLRNLKNMFTSNLNNDYEGVSQMKKVSLIIVCAVMLLTVFPMNALAGANCNYKYESPVKHSYNGRSFHLHSFSGDRCIYCGYTREGQDGYNRTNLNTLQKLGNEIMLNSCWVMYDCPVYSDSTESSWVCDWLTFNGTDYYVGDYEVFGDQMWVKLIKSAHYGADEIGWVYAGNLYIDENSHPGQSSDIGRPITVTASSAKVRSDAGTEFAWIATVHHGDQFWILDAKTGTNGNGWYKINVDGSEVWIAAGLTDFI